MEDDGKSLGHRMPKRQLVYPFLELQFKDHVHGRDVAEIVPPPMEDRLISFEAKPAGPEQPAE
jgi:hypothetical protein